MGKSGTKSARSEQHKEPQLSLRYMRSLLKEEKNEAFSGKSEKGDSTAGLAATPPPGASFLSKAAVQGLPPGPPSPTPDRDIHGSGWGGVLLPLWALHAGAAWRSSG